MRADVLWNLASLAWLTASGALVDSRTVMAVEFAGSGQRLLDAADGDPARLRRFRAVLGRNDTVFAAFYGTGLLLAQHSLRPIPRAAAGLLTATACAADAVENEGLERALTSLLSDPGKPSAADIPAAMAARAAGLKFALLVPAIAAALWGLRRRSSASAAEE